MIAILVIIKLFMKKDYFGYCSKYGDDYSRCYADENCRIMIDLDGTAFCANKN